MSAVFNVALPVFAIILAGYVSGRVGLLGQASSEALNKFVYWIALPPLLFLAMARASLGEILHWPFIGAFLGSVLAVWGLALLIGAAVHRGRAPILTMQGMNASFSNTGYMGIPLFVAAFGEAGLPPASLATVIMSVVAVGIAVVSLELSGADRRGVGRAVGDVVRALARNPLVVAPVLGIAWSETGVPLPAPVVNFCELTGASASPCALFAIGLFIASRPLAANLAEVGWISALKLFVQPLICWLLIILAFPMEPFWAASAIILAALPTGALTFVVAQQYQVYVERTSAVILVSTVLSVVTLSALLAIYAP
ncbi:MAG TPA: AEC family transporter [Alphaproteobacteria bacterium]|nr:AEC family transporter [Alphaproteobacteria bacterium]